MEPTMSTTALLVIDVQNDYFPGGTLPLWNVEVTLDRIEQAINRATAQGMPVILVQHLAESSLGFVPGTPGAELHPRVRTAAPDAPVVTKQFADSFYQTDLEGILAGLGVTGLLVTGMMTQNCVTHTAISKAAEKYDVVMLPDCCTTVSQLIHLIALRAVSTRLPLTPSNEAF
jgi:nicotinamidase-related amidase